MTWIHWAILSAFFAGITAVLAKVGVTGIDSNLATAIRTTVVLIFTWGIFFVLPRSADALSLTRKSWCFLILSGLATGFSWVCYFRALQMGEASRVAPVDKLSVVFAMIFAVMMLKEKLTWHQWVGGSLILMGSMIMALKS